MKNKILNNKGFTLIEIIVVLVIISILMTIAMPSIFGYTQKGQETAAISECRSVVTAAIQELSDKYVKTGNREFDSDVINKSIALSNVEGYVQNQRIGSEELIEYLEYVHPSGIVAIYENGKYRIAGDGETTVTPTPPTPSEPENPTPPPTPSEPETSAPPVTEEQPTVTEPTTEVTSSVAIVGEDDNFYIIPENKSWEEMKATIISYANGDTTKPTHLPFMKGDLFYDNGKLYLFVYDNSHSVTNDHYQNGVFNQNTSLTEFLEKSGANKNNYVIIDKNSKPYNRSDYPDANDMPWDSDPSYSPDKNPILYKNNLVYDNGKLYIIIAEKVQMKQFHESWARMEVPTDVISGA